MQDEKAARLAAIRAANAARKAASASEPVATETVSIAASVETVPSDAAPASVHEVAQTAPAVVPVREGAATGAATPLPPTPPATHVHSVANQTRGQVSDGEDLSEREPAISLPALISLLLAASVGALGAAVLLPAWSPGLAESLLGPEPKAYWYLSRASAFVAYGLVWLSMVFGLLMTSRTAKIWPGGPAAFDIHQHTSLLGLAFALFHGLILLGDGYIGFDLIQVLAPFSSTYSPFWTGLGQLGFYMLLLVGLSFYVRPQIGRAAWRAIHLLSFLLFVLALGHGIFSGSDSSTLWAGAIYWVSGGTVLFLTIYRVLVTWRPSEQKVVTTQ
jgi:DMSO/TMAO reductase YedYZ heme-binding membrane subunit